MERPRHSVGMLIATALVCAICSCSSQSTTPTGTGGTSSSAGTTSGASAGTTSGGSSAGTSGGSTGSAATPSTASVNATTLAFGAVSCGTSASAQNVILSAANGTGSFTYTASLGQGATSPYKVTIGATDTVSPSTPATITITPNPIPQSVATLPGTFNDTLTLTTSGASNDTTPLVVSLTEGAEGVILAFNVSSIPFGSIAAGTQQSSGFTVTNSGNVAAPITLATTTQVYTATPATGTVTAGGGQIAGNVTFAPPASGIYNDTVAVTLGNGATFCQPAPSIVLSGVGVSGGIGLSSNALSFGNVPCGTTAAAQSFTLTNAGNGPMTFSAQLQSGTAFTLGCTPSTACAESGSAWSGSLAASGVATFTVTPQPIPQTSAVTPNLYSDVVDINTNVVGLSSAQVSVAETASGAILSFSPTAVSFGSVPITTTSASQPFQVVNAGNANAGVLVSSPNADFALSFDGGALDPSADTAVAAGGAQTFGATFAPGGSTSAQLSNLALTTDSSTVLCAPLPGSDAGSTDLALSGQGTNGSVAYSPSALSFGLVNCGAQASPQTVTFTNDGNQAYTISGALDAGTAYAFTLNPISGTVAPDGGTATITVTPAAIPQTSAVPGSYGDYLTIDTSVNDGDGGTINVVIPLAESAQGVILENFSPANGQIAFPNTATGAASTYGLYLENHGNVNATLAYSNVTPPAEYSFAPVTVPANGNASWNATFTPAAVQSYPGSANIGVAAGTVLCQPLPDPPSTVTLSGAGTNAATFTESPTSVHFGQVSCGSSAPPAQQVTLGNTGTSAVSYTAALASGQYFAITSGASGSVAASTGTATITVAADSLGTGTGKTGLLGDTLTITYGPSNDTIPVAIDETAEGVVLTWVPGAFAFSACAAGGTNQDDVLDDSKGNQGATVTLATSGDTHKELTLGSNPLAVVAGSTATETVTCTNPNLGGLGTAPAETVTVTTSVPAGTPLCASLPGAYAITTP
jgi:hypothetical protein